MVGSIATKAVEAAGETLWLSNRRAVFWERESALILADLHVGKTAHFRRHGIAIPKDVLQNDLARLEALIRHFGAQDVYINGDLLHAGDNSDVDFFCRWKDSQNVGFHLILGNHDRIPKDLHGKLCLKTVEKSVEISPFTLIHEYEPARGGFQITGHIHPGKVFRSAVKNLRMPCYILSGDQLLLPAFSLFTGLDTKNLPQGRSFVFSENEIYEI